jgi:predicted amidohydrolase
MPGYLFQNANLVLDGETALQPSYNVLVSDDRIIAVTRDPVAAEGASVIDVAGGTPMPGLIDTRFFPACGRSGRPHLRRGDPGFLKQTTDHRLESR